MYYTRRSPPHFIRKIRLALNKIYSAPLITLADIIKTMATGFPRITVEFIKRPTKITAFRRNIVAKTFIKFIKFIKFMATDLVRITTDFFYQI